MFPNFPKRMPNPERQIRIDKAYDLVMKDAVMFRFVIGASTF